MKRARKHTLPKRRNPVARSPLLGKGGVHAKTTRAKRRAANVVTAKLVRDPEQVE